MIFYTIMLPIIIGLLFFTFFIVKQQSAAVVERFGKFVSVRQSGLQIKIPIKNFGKYRTEILMMKKKRKNRK